MFQTRRDVLDRAISALEVVSLSLKSPSAFRVQLLALQRLGAVGGGDVALAYRAGVASAAEDGAYAITTQIAADLAQISRGCDRA